ncbi:Mobile element protein [Cystobacter fuscus DSM 2262]|uniref:Mobile element protein n=1 Tax=Cystobacter fuscus (strain ATCC 25194 / DSM 2262 / NBRC 100088 / M29) TaxID=1242864 RepID=S9PH25_CYSF2|nr:Mobile element protein [Cystobacter fuscus DSM 2262]
MEVEQLACCESAGVGLQMTHWSIRSLALVARFALTTRMSG